MQQNTYGINGMPYVKKDMTIKQEFLILEDLEKGEYNVNHSISILF
jgi:hypothetical protein